MKTTHAQVSTPATKVIFRKYPAGDLIALFPEVPSDPKGIYCESYQIVGQHGGADCRGVIATTKPATPAEYAAIHAELVRIGYVLEIRRRSPGNAYAVRQAELNRVRTPAAA